MEQNFKETLNLPQTNMPMRAGLAKREPEFLAIWEAQNLYQKIQTKNQDKPAFILHDGPPYPNGDIHLGHALNKILKDIILKYKTMKGYSAPYVPGWDCHGLPIEIQLLKDLKKKKLEHKKEDTLWFRNECRNYALRYVATQKEQFKRLGIFGDWQNPYLTLNPEYEASIIEQFGDLVDNGYIYRGRKPIHWCSSCETALAEAEIEYDEEKSASIYLKFVITKNPKKIEGVTTDGQTALVVWTTTPWTLPANVAAAVHPEHEYQIVLDPQRQKRYILITELQEKVCSKLEINNPQVIAKLKGQELASLFYTHPFIEQESPVVTAEYVSNEDGTGIVHIAPGHGYDDYLVGLKYKLPIVMPVNDQGCFTKDAPSFLVGQPVFKANQDIIEKLQANEMLLKIETLKHSYPHCWRCKKPVIFRATKQWFVAMDQKTTNPEAAKEEHLRSKAQAEIKKTKWIPAWGEGRITSMIEARPDWCISRQRSWGIPIPVIYCECG
ncbi:MAG: Isoleucyl-tRNA synthetase, partial [Candidatus Magnetoglobus multicellularis str. Araruama]